MRNLSFMKKTVIYIICSLAVFSLFACSNIDSSHTSELDTKNQTQYVYPLYEDENITLTGYVGLSVGTGLPTFAVYAENHTDSQINIVIDNVVLDDSIEMNYIYSYVYAEDSSWTYLDGIQNVLNLADLTMFSKFSGELLYGLPGDYYENPICKDIPIEFEVSEDFEPKLVCLPCRKASAEEQVLLDNDKLQVTLVNMGSFLGNNSTDKLNGILVFKNKTDYRMPVHITGYEVNGYFLEGYVNTILRGNSDNFVQFDLYESSLNEAGISDISSFSIMMLTDKSENTGILTSEGGSWYPVELSLKSEEDPVYPEGEVKYEDDVFEIIYLGYEYDESSIASYPDFHVWNIEIVNKSDMNIELEPYNEYHKNPDNIFDRDFIWNNQVGAHTRRKAEIRVPENDNIDASHYVTQLKVEIMGGGEYLYVTDKEMSFTCDE